MPSLKGAASAVCLIAVCTAFAPAASAGPAGSFARRSAPAIVKVFTVYDTPDHYSPWQTLGIEKSTGSGAVIAGNRILTNAHVVADQRSVQVKRSDRPKRYDARVAFVSHQADLSILEVEDERFFEDVVPLELGRLARMGEKVDVYGYPEGGESISITSGIVSRMEMQTYVHSGETLLAIQIDAALNPGNSGGPVMADGKIAGVAMQMLEDAENIGYVVPAPVVKHFLRDIDDGRLDGVPRLGAKWQHIVNGAQRRKLGLDPGKDGVLITAVDSGSTADGALEVGDVVTAVDGMAVGEDATVALDNGNRVALSFAFQFKQVGDTVAVELKRGNETLSRKLTLANTKDLIPGPIYDARPSYLIYGGLVFQPLGFDYIDVWEEWPSLMAMHYEHANVRTAERSQLILLTQVLSARVNRGYQDFDFAVLDTAQAKVPRDLADLARIVDESTEDLLEFRMQSGARVVLDRKQAVETEGLILKRYGIPRARSHDLKAAALR